MSANETIANTFGNLREAFRSRPWLCLFAIYAAMLVFHGFSESDIPDFVHISRDTLHVLAPVKRQFLYSSPLNFMLGDMLGIPTFTGFYLIHGTGIIAMLVTIFFCVRKKFPAKDEQIRFLALLSLTPLWLITLKWIGKPDPILISMMFLCWAWPGQWRWIFAAIMVMAHREMGSFMCLFLFVSEEKPDLSLIFSVLIGQAFHWSYENLVLDQVPSSRVEDITIDIWRHPAEFAQRPVLYFLASLSWYWIVVLWQRPNLRIALAWAAAFCVAVVSEDFTRDFILMALAPLLFHLERVVKTPASAALMRYAPLFLLQIQIAAMGVIFKFNNIWYDWATGNLGNQLIR